MLIIEQEEKQGPAYLCVKQIKVDKDPLISQESLDQRGIKIFHDGKYFFVKEKHMPIKQIHNYDVDSLLQKMNPYQLNTFQKTAGFLIAKRLSNGEYKLDARVKGSGGKPGFETVITVGKVILENTSAVMKVAEKVATLAMFNAASKWVTGKNLSELAHDRHERRSNGYDPEAAIRMREQEKLQEEYHRDMRIKHGASPNDTAFKWDEKYQCFVDEYGDRHYIANQPAIKPQTDVVYTGRKLPIVSPSKPADEPYKPEFYEDGTRIVDYENNPADKAWLEDFAKKICPDGGYVIGDVLIPVNEDLPSSPVDVAMPMPTPPQPNDPKHDKKLDKKLHELEHSLGHAAVEGLHKLYEDYTDHHPELDIDIEKAEKLPIVGNIIKSHTPTTQKTTTHKGPVYSAGDYKRSSYSSNQKETKTTTPAKVESITIKQESPVKLESVKQEPVKQETNASRWANDYDYSSNEPDISYLDSMNDDEVSDFFDGFPELYEAYTSNK